MTPNRKKSTCLQTVAANSQYWKKKHFFTDAGYEYLLGYETKKGMKYDYNTKMVRDNKVRGNICMKYILVKE